MPSNRFYYWAQPGWGNRIWPKHDWQQHDGKDKTLSALIDEFPLLRELDSFDQVQLAHVLTVCRNSKTQAEAGRKLFAVSRQEKINNGKTPNDSHRLGQYLKKYGLSFRNLCTNACT